MKIINHFRETSDLAQWKESAALIAVVEKIYNTPPLGVDRIKENNFPLLIFFNMVRTIYDKLVCSDMPSYEMKQLWNEINPYQTNAPKSNNNIKLPIIKNIPKGRAFNFAPARYYEAIDVMSAVYFLLLLNHSSQTQLLAEIESTVRFPVDNKNAYTNFDYFRTCAQGIKIHVLNQENEKLRSENEDYESACIERDAEIANLQLQLKKYKNGEIFQDGDSHVAIEDMLRVCQNYYPEQVRLVANAICFTLAQTNRNALPYVENLCRILGIEDNAPTINISQARDITHIEHSTIYSAKSVIEA